MYKLNVIKKTWLQRASFVSKSRCQYLAHVNYFVQVGNGRLKFCAAHMHRTHFGGTDFTLMRTNFFLFYFCFAQTTVNSIMNHPKCGPKSGLAHNTSAYLKFGLPRVVARSSGREESSGYDSSNDGSPVLRSKNLLLSRSDPDFRKNLIYNNPNGPSGDGGGGNRGGGRERRMKSISEANLLSSKSQTLIRNMRCKLKSRLCCSRNRSPWKTIM
jgi:hypothetical protein